jgi:rRNA-processing protein FCF1
MKKIILDTSFLISCANFKIDWEQELKRICDFAFEVILLDRVAEELKTVRKDKIAAKLALAILKHKKIYAIPTAGDERQSVDSLIVAFAAKNKALVATQDLGLKQRLRAKLARTITIRQKGHLVLE